MTWCENGIAPEMMRQEAIESLIYHWSAVEGSLNALNALHERYEAGDEFYGQQLEEVAMQLAVDDPAAVAEWLNSKEELGLVSDRVVNGLIYSMMLEYPDIAFSWTSHILDRQQHEVTTRGVLESWFSQDADSACAWLADHGDQLCPENLQFALTVVQELKDRNKFLVSDK